MSINNRAHKRFEVEPGKWVKIWSNDPGLQILQLIDISQGGMSFLALAAGEYKRGDHLLVVDFKDKSLKRKILAVVRYVKINVQVGADYTDYKVGVEFLKVAS